MIVLGTYDFIKIQQMCYAANSTSYDWQIIDFKSDLQHDIWTVWFSVKRKLVALFSQVLIIFVIHLFLMRLLLCLFMLKNDTDYDLLCSMIMMHW